MNDTSTRTRAAIDELAAVVGDIERQVDDWAQETSSWLSADPRLTGALIDNVVRPAVQSMLQSGQPRIAGAGFIANAGLLAPDRSYIAWWQGEDLERVDALVNFSPQSMSRYVKAEWFRIPVGTRKPHVTGPHIDLLYTDEYVLTFTQPVFRGADVAGIVGLDVTAQTLERLGLPLLCAIGPRAALVNADGRTIVCAAGDIVRPADGALKLPIGRAFRLLTAVDG